MQMTVTRSGLAFLAVLLFASGCGKKAAVKTPPPIAPATLAIEEADRAYAFGDYVTAARRYEDYLNLSAPGDSQDRALFFLGVIYGLPEYPQHDLNRARSWLQQLVEAYPWSPLKPTAQAMLKLHTDIAQLTASRDERDSQIRELTAEVERLKQEPARLAIQEASEAFHSDDYARAVAKSEEYLRLAPSGSQRDIALFQLGVIHGLPVYPQRSPERAVQYLKQLLAEHPQSELRAPAQAWVALLENITQLTADKEKQATEVRRLLNQLESLKRIDSQRLRRKP